MWAPLQFWIFHVLLLLTVEHTSLSKYTPLDLSVERRVLVDFFLSVQVAHTCTVVSEPSMRSKIRLHAYGVCRHPRTLLMVKITSHGQCADQHGMRTAEVYTLGFSVTTYRKLWLWVCLNVVKHPNRASRTSWWPDFCMEMRCLPTTPADTNDQPFTTVLQDKRPDIKNTPYWSPV